MEKVGGGKFYRKGVWKERRGANFVGKEYEREEGGGGANFIGEE